MNWKRGLELRHLSSAFPPYSAGRARNYFAPQCSIKEKLRLYIMRTAVKLQAKNIRNFWASINTLYGVIAAHVANFRSEAKEQRTVRLMEPCRDI